MGNTSIEDKACFKKILLLRIARVIPIVYWLPRYQSAWIWPDMAAGLTLAACAVPLAMAYSSLASLPPQVGLYCCVFSGIAYAFFATSRHLAIGPTTSISIMVASVLGVLAGGDASLYAGMAAMTAALVSVICILAWLMRLSSFVNFISESSLLGFKAGAALSIASTQLPKLFGVDGGGHNFFENIATTFRQLGDTNLTALMLGVCSLLLILAGEHFFPRRPVPLVVVVIAIGAVSMLGLADKGVRVVGFIPAGLPAFEIPTIRYQYIDGLLELAFACFLLSYIESMAAARTFAAKYHYSVDPRQELLGLGAANLVAALGHGYPVAGGMSQSAVNEKAGARTPLSLIIASIAIVAVLFSLTGLMRNLPETVLAAIVLVSVAGFVKIDEFKRLWQISRLEFNVALVAFFGVLLLGILKGVTISAIASILFLLRMIAKPHVAVLGRIPGTLRFSDVNRHDNNEQFPGLYLFRIEAPLLYFNVDNISATIMESLHREATPVKLAVCDLSTSPYIDAAGAQMLARLEEKLERENIQFRVVEAHAEVRDILRATGISEILGGVSRYTALADVVEDFERGTGIAGS